MKMFELKSGAQNLVGDIEELKKAFYKYVIEKDGFEISDLDSSEFELLKRSTVVLDKAKRYMVSQAVTLDRILNSLERIEKKLDKIPNKG